MLTEVVEGGELDARGVVEGGELDARAVRSNTFTRKSLPKICTKT